MLNLEALEHILYQATHPNQKLRAYLRLVYYTLDCQPQLCQNYIQEAFKLAYQLNDQSAIAFLHTDRLMLAIMQGQVDTMQEILNELIVSLVKIKGHLLHNFLLGSLYSFLASAFENKNYQVKAIHYYYRCLNRVEQIPTDEYLDTFFFDIKTKLLNNIAYSLIVLERYEEAEAHLKLAEYFFSDLTALLDRVEHLHWQARLYELTRRYEQAIQAADASISLSRNCPYPMLRNVLTYAIKGRALVKYKQDYQQAIACFEQSNQIAEKFDFWLSIGNNYEHLARCCELSQQEQQAFAYYKLAIKAQKKTSLNYLNQTFRLIRSRLELLALDSPKNNFSIHQLLDPNLPLDTAPLSESALIFAWIYTHIDRKDFGVEDIAAHFKVSTRTINRRLQLFFNMTATQLINQQKLKKAYTLITTTSLSIMDIAELVGIDHTSYFSIAFRRFFGVKPSELRQHIS
jgi:AraC-like DNA-binding protein